MKVKLKVVGLAKRMEGEKERHTKVHTATAGAAPGAGLNTLKEKNWENSPGFPSKAGSK